MHSLALELIFDRLGTCYLRNWYYRGMLLTHLSATSGSSGGAEFGAEQVSKPYDRNKIKGPAHQIAFRTRAMGKKPTLTIPKDAVDVSFEKAEGERLGVFLREKDIGHDVCVNTVADDSPAYLELSPGDIIEAVNGVRVKSAVQ